MVEAPEWIRVAQDGSGQNGGFWTCAAATEASPKYIRADLVDARIAALKAENERLEIAKREAIAGYAAAERALAERAGEVKFAGNIPGSSYASRLSPLTTEPAAPEGRQDDEPRAYIVHAPEDDYYGTGPDRLQFHPLAQHDLDNGYRQTPLYGRPAEQAVTEAARRVLEWVYPIAGDNRDEAAAKEEIDSVEALKAAMEAGR